MDLVSVVITSYKRDQLLRRAILSVLNQTYKNIQLVVIIDHPMSDTPYKDIFKDERLEVYVNSENLGVQKSRNKGIDLCRGKYYLNLDDDDFFHKERIKELLQFYKTFKDALSFVSSKYSKMTNSFNLELVSSSKVGLNRILYSNKVGNSILTELHKVKSVGGWDEKLAAAQDYDLWIRLIYKFGDSRILNENLLTVDDSHHEKRITDSLSMLEGYQNCFNKHKHIMLKSHVKYNVFKLKRLGDSDYNLIDVFMNVPYWLLPFEVVLFFKRGKRKS